MSLALTDYKYHKIVQVMTYVLLYTQVRDFDVEKRELQVGMYSFKNLKSGFLAMNFSDSRQKDFEVTKEHIELFQATFLNLIDNILDEKLPFVQNLENPFQIEA